MRNGIYSTLFCGLTLLILCPCSGFSREQPEAKSPAFTTVPELRAGFDSLYNQRFAEGRHAFESWESRNPEEPIGEVAIAASYLFEELHQQKVLTSDFFLDEKRFLRGIDGTPNPERMRYFRESLKKARELAHKRQRVDSNDGEALFALTLADGMESDALAILDKKHLEALKRMKEANKYAKQLLARYPDATDAYIAPGISNYIVGSLSPGSRFGLWFGGIHGNVNVGMSQMAKTAKSGRYLRTYAKIILALAARRENQPALAERLFLELKEEYPGNASYALEYSKVRRASLNGHS